MFHHCNLLVALRRDEADEWCQAERMYDARPLGIAGLADPAKARTIMLTRTNGSGALEIPATVLRPPDDDRRMVVGVYIDSDDRSDGLLRFFDCHNFPSLGWAGHAIGLLMVDLGRESLEGLPCTAFIGDDEDRIEWGTGFTPEFFEDFLVIVAA